MSNVFKITGNRNIEINFRSWEDLEKEECIRWYKKFPINCSMMKFHTFSLREDKGKHFLLAEYNNLELNPTKIVVGTFEQDVDGLPSETPWEVGCVFYD